MQSENLLEPANYSSHKIKWGAWGVSNESNNNTNANKTINYEY